MVPVSVEVLVGGGVLQRAGHRAQDVALLRLQGRAGGAIHNVEPVRGHDGRVHVAVVDQVTNNLRGRREGDSDEPLGAGGWGLV